MRVFHPASLAAVLILSTPLSAGPPTTSDPGELRRQLRAIGAKIQAEQAALRRREGEAGRVRSKLLELDRRIQAVAQESDALRVRVWNTEHRLQELTRRRARMGERVRRSRDSLARVLPALQRLRRGGAVRVLLSLDDPQALERSLHYLRYVRTALAGQLSEALGSLREATALEEEAQTQRRQLETQQERLSASRKRLDDAYAERKAQLARLEQAVSAARDRLGALKQRQDALTKLLDELEAAVENLPVPEVVQFSRLRGRLPWPAEGRVVNLYGQPRAGTSTRWRGAVIEARLGDPVRAVAHGRVVYADWFRGYGFLLIVDHGDGYMSLYGYNQAIYKTLGEWVEAGERIASVGMSGPREKPGVYFELRHKGVAMNPARWCSKARRGAADNRRRETSPGAERHSAAR